MEQPIEFFRYHTWSSQLVTSITHSVLSWLIPQVTNCLNVRNVQNCSAVKRAWSSMFHINTAGMRWVETTRWFFTRKDENVLWVLGWWLWVCESVLCEWIPWCELARERCSGICYIKGDCHWIRPSWRLRVGSKGVLWLLIILNRIVLLSSCLHVLSVHFHLLHV